MIIFGIHPVLEALEAGGDRVQRLSVSQGKGGKQLQQVIDRARAINIPLHFEPAAALDRKAGSSRHQGVVADISPIRLHTLAEILELRPELLLTLDGVEDPRNLGSVLRTAEAAGVGAVLLPERRTCGITPTVVKTSAGGAIHVRICRAGNVANTLKQLKDAGYWVLGLDLQGQEGIDQIETSWPLAVVVGGEHRGLRRLIREHCDSLVRIPMQGKVASLNLSVAAAILLYTVRLQRRRRRCSR